MEKPTIGDKCRALLATGRMANLPTVWSNVLVGFSLASILGGNYLSQENGNIFWNWNFIFLLVASSVIYVGGCMLGDVRDLQFDRENRPSRPLPQRVISVTSVSLSAWFLLLGGLSIVILSPLVSSIIEFQPRWVNLIVFFNTTSIESLIHLDEVIIATLLVSCVTTYAFVHKKNKIVALSLMAFCRFLLVFLAISFAYILPMQHDSIYITLWMAGAVGLYTLLLSWVASTEVTPGHFRYRRFLATALLLIPLASLAIPPFINHILSGLGQDFFMRPHTMIHYTTMAVCIAWSMFALRALNDSKPTFVSRALAGFCLLDACFAATFSPIIALVCLGLFCLALLLQRVTPAT